MQFEEERFMVEEEESEWDIISSVGEESTGDGTGDGTGDSTRAERRLRKSREEDLRPTGASWKRPFDLLERTGGSIRRVSERRARGLGHGFRGAGAGWGAREARGAGAGERGGRARGKQGIVCMVGDSWQTLGGTAGARVGGGEVFQRSFRVGARARHVPGTRRPGVTLSGRCYPADGETCFHFAPCRQI